MPCHQCKSYCTENQFCGFVLLRPLPPARSAPWNSPFLLNAPVGADFGSSPPAVPIPDSSRSACHTKAVRSARPLRDGSSNVPREASPPLAQSPDSIPLSSGSADPATPADSRERRLAHGASRIDSRCSRPCSHHSLSLQRSPSFSATDCSWFMMRVRVCTMRCPCHSGCRRSRFSQLGSF